METEEKEDEMHDVVLTGDNSVDTQSYLRIVHIDVSQGESTLILHQEGSDIRYAALIDGGKSQYAVHILDTLKAYGVKKLDAIISTHFDADHIEGLTTLMRGKKMPFAFAFDRGAEKNDDKPQAFKREAGIKYRPMSAFETVVSPSFGFKCLHYDDEGGRPQEENDYSTIMQVSLGSFTYYTAGDQCRTLELLYAPNNCAAFKCGHHGSKHSTSNRLLEKMGAQVAFVSAGSHSYCHPDHSVLDILHNNAAIKGIYLTNCSYNRPQVNTGYLQNEAEHFLRYVDNIKKAIQISNGVPDQGGLEDMLQESALAIQRNDWNAYATKMEELNGYLARTPPKSVRKAIEAACQAATIYNTERTRKETREFKAWVAGTPKLLGNIELFVCAAGYAVGFVSESGQPVWHCRDHKGATIGYLPVTDVKKVERSINREPSFSLLTAQVSAVERIEIELSSREKREIERNDAFFESWQAKKQLIKDLRTCRSADCKNRLSWRDSKNGGFCEECVGKAVNEVEAEEQVEEQGSALDKGFQDS